MIYIILSLLWLTPAFLGIGYALRRVSVVQSISGYLLNGIITISIAWGILAFFIPINIYVELLTTIIGFFFFFKYKLYNKFRKIKLSFSFYILLLTIIFSGTFAPFILDHFGYYVPTMTWIKEFGWVQGIANLEWVLGQMSFWHLLDGGLSNFSDPFYRINTIFLTYFLLYVYEKRYYILLFFLPLCLLFTQSPSPDLPVILLSLIIVFEAINGNRKYNNLFFWSIVIFIIKPTMIWVPIFILLYILKNRPFNPKYFLLGILVGFIYLIKNIWVSGYPLFPTPFADLPFFWKADSHNIAISSQFALMKSFDMVYNYDQLKDLSFFQRAKLWLTLPGLKGFINIFFIFSWLLFTLFCIKAKKRILWLLYIALLIKTIFVLAFSAQYRFVIDVLVIMYSILLLKIIKERFIKSSAILLSIIIVLFLSFPQVLHNCIPSFRLSGYMKPFRISQSYKPAAYSWNKFSTEKIGNVSFNIVEDYSFIFDGTLPAITIYNLEDYLKMDYIPQYIDAKKKKGFYPRQLSPSERLQLKEILKKHKIRK